MEMYCSNIWSEKINHWLISLILDFDVSILKLDLMQKWIILLKQVKFYLQVQRRKF